MLVLFGFRAVDERCNGGLEVAEGGERLTSVFHGGWGGGVKDYFFHRGQNPKTLSEIRHRKRLSSKPYKPEAPKDPSKRDIKV